MGKHHPRGPSEPEPGLGEGDVSRGLLFQVPKTEVTTPAPCGGGQRTGVRCRPRKGYSTPPVRRHSLRQQEDGFPTSRPHVVPTSSLTFRGLRHGGAQAVHVVTPIAVIAKQQLVNTLKRPKRPPLREFFVDDFEELLEGERSPPPLTPAACGPVNVMASLVPRPLHFLRTVAWAFARIRDSSPEAV